MDIPKNIPLDDQNVPEAHQGLHSFLYSSEDEHSAIETKVPEAHDQAEILPLDQWSDRATNAKVAGVYAVLDDQQQTQYIGYSRNVLISLKGHVSQLGPQICAFVRVQSFKFPKREEMEKLKNLWLSDLDYLPPGNSDQSGMWAGTVREASTAAMSAQERQIYEDKKLKLRKAMADTALSKEPQSGEAQGQQLKQAVESDDWSAVINDQTQETQSS